MRALVALLAAMLLAAGPAAAQHPTTQQMIDQLRPGDGESTTRGVLRLPQLQLNVRFAFDSAELTAEARAVLDRLGQALTNQQLAPYRFRLVGHTDARGTEAYNLALSQRRADAARAYLMQRWNIAPARLMAEGMGFQELADPANPEAPANRRVQVINEGPAP
jgi:outer membrane protein OmpA-like peptidoglycan-associated protein